MKRNASIEDVLIKIDNHSIKKIIQSPLKGYLIILAGIILFVFYAISQDSKLNFLSPIFILAGVFIILWGSIDTFIPIIYFKDTRNGERINFKETYYDKSDHLKLIELIENEDIDELSTLHKSNGVQGVKLRVAINKDKTICLVQVLKFVEYDFAITSKVKQISLDHAKKLVSMVFQNEDNL